jgi:predicted nucleotidyltransferase
MAASVVSVVHEVLATAPDVATAYLYGSAARGELRADSDIDVGVLIEPSRTSTFSVCQDIEERLERRTGRRAEVIDLDRAPVDLVQRVLRDGMLLIDRVPALRVRFEVRRRNEWFDLEPLLRAYRRSGAA